MILQICYLASAGGVVEAIWSKDLLHSAEAKRTPTKERTRPSTAFGMKKAEREAEFVTITSFQKGKAPGIAKKLRGSKKSIRVDSSVAPCPRKAGGIPAIDAARIFHLETSVLTGASLEQGRRDLPSKAGRDYPVGLR